MYDHFIANLLLNHTRFSYLHWHLLRRSTRVRRTHVDVNEVDGIANVLENGLVRHVQLATVDTSQLSAVQHTASYLLCTLPTITKPTGLKLKNKKV